MFCDFCGHQLADSSRFCKNCGRQFLTAPIASIPAFSQAPPKKTHIILKTVGLVLVLVVVGLVALVIFAYQSAVRDFSKQDGGTQSELSAQPNPAITSSEQKLPDPAAKKAAQKVLRETWAAETQKDLWRQGMEMTFQAHGTTLYVKYVLAGDAFAFQFHEEFMHDNAETLKGLGFKNVELSNGDNVWSWKLSK